MSEENITRLNINDKEIILIGTAHVSKRSAEQVKEVIEAEQPDTVCVELDEQRYDSIMDENRWRNMDIFKVIKNGKATFLLMNLAISSFQKRMAKQFGIQAGQEMIQGIESAEEVGAELVLADRNIQTTFSRIWRGIGLKAKAMLLTSVFAGIFSNETITEEELEEMKSQDMLDSMLQEYTENFPSLKVTLIDERDQYLAQKIKDAPGKKIVAVLGAAHVPTITKEIHKEHDLQRLVQKPTKSRWPKIIGWSIPVIIIGLILFTLLNNPVAAVLAGGHVLIEGVPGTGKTQMVRSLARLINGDFNRVQFTPDLLPSDITGSTIYNIHEGAFDTIKGPIFTNML